MSFPFTPPVDFFPHCLGTVAGTQVKTRLLVAVHLTIMILAVFHAGIKSFIFME